MIDRRTFLAGTGAVLLAAPLAADAQQAGKVPRIGFLGTFTSPSLDAFRQALREFEWVEGQNIVIDYRFAEGRLDRLPDLAAELVRLKVDIIVAVATPATAAAKNATETIPIVMISVGDPVGIGLIASLAGALLLAAAAQGAAEPRQAPPGAAPVPFTVTIGPPPT